MCTPCTISIIIIIIISHIHPNLDFYTTAMISKKIVFGGFGGFKMTSISVTGDTDAVVHF